MERRNDMANLSLILISVILGATGQFLFRFGMKSYGQVSAAGVFSQLFSIIFKPAIFIGFILFGMSSIIWLSVISKNQLSYAYPMVGLGYILTLVLSYLFLNEQVGLYRILGTLLIVSGVMIISKS
jgi:drug/metabolite transporter (DMT)-like permease